jgi:aminoglycoside phosphotransferase (APT) family kinase protein
MKNLWDPDFEISSAQAAQLIEQQFPQLAPARLELLGIGWDNLAFLVNARFVFRFPRREIAAPLIEREARVLPRLAPHLPLRIPVPEFFAAPSRDYAHAFAGYTLIPGQTACRCEWSEHERAEQAATLANFLRLLHHIPIDVETLNWAPRDEFARTDLEARAAKLKERLASNAAMLRADELCALLELVDELAATTPSATRLCWVHGDFYARHLICENKRIAGVIDWGDVHLGDPALDLSIAFSFLPPSARNSFREIYGESDEATWQRARFRALHYAAALTEYGAAIGDAAIKAAGEYALRNAPQ